MIMSDVEIWPPSLGLLKSDMGLEQDDIVGADAFRAVLEAAITFVESVRPDLNFALDPVSELPLPDAATRLGTIRLAARWKARGRSPEALISMGEFGSARVPSFDPDIERLLKIGRFRKADFA